MKKITLVILFATTLSVAVSAQEKSFFSFGLSTEAAFPVSTQFRDNYQTGYGGAFRVQYGSSLLRAGSLSVGYVSFTGKGSGARVNSQVGVLPVLLGVRHNLARKWYVEPQGGYAWYFFSNTLNGVNTKRTESAVSFALSTGIVTKDFDLSIRYQDAPVEANNSFGNVSVRIGYLLSTRKGK